MKMGSLRDGTRDGAFVIVADDLKTAIAADGVAPSLRAVLEDWDRAAPALRALAAEGESFPLEGRVFE